MRDRVVLGSRGGAPKLDRRGQFDRGSAAKEFITMTPDENVAIMRRAYEAFNTGDIGTLT